MTVFNLENYKDLFKDGDSFERMVSLFETATSDTCNYCLLINNETVLGSLVSVELTEEAHRKRVMKNLMKGIEEFKTDARNQ